MMLPWKRKEVWVGNSMREWNRRRGILEQNGIRYDDKIKDRMKCDFQGRINGMARMMENPAYSSMYYLYVSKQDFDRARFILEHAARE
ncbi:MAG: hypothetical protein LKJ17_06385 [Oscillospiraceae bacterium]|jgi:hypothetical protein|nr:hypothetical protein [Oscillospiraceae bacterium]